ncbi:MAG: serine/threonine-protein kinase, partial [Thermoguttaceae bacterium]
MVQWNAKANEIFVRAAEFDAADERQRFVESECGEDGTLLAQVESLLAAGDCMGNFLEKPVAPGPFAAAPTIDGPPVFEAAGTVIGPYKLLQQIGEGGMGIVYMAEQQEPVRRKVAVKIIKPGMDSAQVIARFEAERQALAMMDHQNIAKVFDAGTTGTGRPYFVMELVHGVSLTSFCDDNRLTLRQRLELLIPVCHAIQHAHQKGIIHRDVKPSNVLVTMYDDRPVPKVIDFGIAKATDQQLTERTMFTQFGAMVGTFEYMSPEQAEMNAFGVDTRSDIYSLGVLLYELLTGSTPLEKSRLRAAAFNELVRIIKEEEPPRPSVRLSKSGQSKSGTAASIAAARKTEPQQLSKLVRGDLDWIVMRCLEKQRDRRYETANGLARDIQRYLVDEPVEARPPSAAYRLRKFIRRNKGRVIAACLVLLALIAGIVGTSWQMVVAERQRKAADDARAVAENEKDQKERERARADDERRRADAKAAEALTERDRANKSAAAALAEKHRAEKELLHSERLLYASHIASAQREWETNNAAGASQHLDACRADFRGWEYDYVRGLLTQNQLTIKSKSPCLRLAFSPDGKKVAGGCGLPDNTITVWDSMDGRQLLVLKGHTGPVWSVAFSPDGKRLVSGSGDKSAKLWDATNGQEIRSLKAHADQVNSVAFSPDGKRIATGGNDRLARIWDATSGREMFTLEGHTDNVGIVAFSPDGTRLVSATSNAPTSFGSLKLPLPSNS